MKVQEESEKAGLKLNIQKTNIRASGPITSWQIMEKSENSGRFYFPGLQSHCGQWPQPQIKRCLLTGRKATTDIHSVQSLSRVWPCNLMDCSMPSLPVHHQLPEFTQTHVHWVGDAIQPSQPLSSPSPPCLQSFPASGSFRWVSTSHLVAKALEFQLQHQSFQWIFRTDFL